MDKSEKAFHENKYFEGENFNIKYKDNFIWRNHWLRIMNCVKNNYFKDSYILNIGSGPGTVEFFLRNTGHSIFSADISYNALKNIKTLNLNNCLINCDILELPFKNKVFDSIIALNILHHIPDFKQCISEIIRVSEHGTIFIALEPWATKFRALLKRVFREKWEISHSPYEKDLTLEELNLLRKYKNIEEITIKPFNPLIPLLKLKFPWRFYIPCVAFDMLLEKLGIGWLHFISFRVK